jgi:hypothetical protein
VSRLSNRKGGTRSAALTRAGPRLRSCYPGMSEFGLYCFLSTPFCALFQQLLSLRRRGCLHLLKACLNMFLGCAHGFQKRSKQFNMSI